VDGVDVVKVKVALGASLHRVPRALSHEFSADDRPRVHAGSTGGFHALLNSTTQLHSAQQSLLRDVPCHSRERSRLRSGKSSARSHKEFGQRPRITTGAHASNVHIIIASNADIYAR